MSITAVCNGIDPPTYRRFNGTASVVGASVVLAVTEASGEWVNCRAYRYSETWLFSGLILAIMRQLPNQVDV